MLEIELRHYNYTCRYKIADLEKWLEKQLNLTVLREQIVKKNLNFEITKILIAVFKKKYCVIYPPETQTHCIRIFLLFLIYIEVIQ